VPNRQTRPEEPAIEGRKISEIRGRASPVLECTKRRAMPAALLPGPRGCGERKIDLLNAPGRSI